MASLLKYSTRVKDFDQTQGTITAYAAAFGNRDSDGDTIHKGAFAKTIRERGPDGTQQIKMLYMHRFDEIIGKVLQIEEDNFGLLFRAKLILENNPTAQKAFALYKADLFEHSVGINVIRPENFRGGDINEVKLFDVSPVTWGANAQTPTVSVKGLTDQPNYVIERIRKIRKAINYADSDEVAKSLQADVDTGLALLEAQITSIIKNHTLEPEDDVLEGVLTHIKANPAAAIGGIAPTAAADAAERHLKHGTPQTEEEWLLAFLTNLRQANA